MNKTITIYELLGMVKDGKAPKKIKYANNIWEYYDGIDYKSHETLLFDACCRINSDDLRSTVEIIEDNDKLEDGFEFTVSGGIWTTKQASELIDNLDKLEKRIIDHINKLEEEIRK